MITGGSPIGLGGIVVPNGIIILEDGGYHPLS